MRPRIFGFLFALMLAASTAWASDPPIVDILAAPRADISKGSFTLKSRILRDVPQGWSYRLYFDTDLNPFTGWFYSRGYEYVAVASGQSVLSVYRTAPTSPDGLGGALVGTGTVSQTDRALSLSVPLTVLGGSDGRLAWELMVFDAGGGWQGSYAGRFE